MILRILVLLSLLSIVEVNSYAQTLDQIAVPVSNPVNFEDPRIQSEVRPIFMYHSIDDKFATKGGSARLYALQARYAVSERLAIIATKDGFVQFQPDATLNDGTGFANVAVGAKYAFYIDDQSTTIGSAGLRYEAAVGDHDVLQGRGDGVANPFISAATVLGKVNVVGYSGFRLPIDNSDSSFFDASAHFDTKLCDWFTPLVEFNMFHTMNGGDRLPIADEGQDLFNIGSSKSTGKTMVSAAFGARISLTKNITWGAVYEIPLDRGNGSRILDWRVTSDLRFAL